MGWDFWHKDSGSTPKEEIVRHLRRGEENPVVDIAMIGQVAYIAYHEPTGAITGVVILTSQPKRDYFNFGIKVIGEEMGPCEDHCPARILNQLTPLTDIPRNMYDAADWRARCRANLAQKKHATALKPGDRVTFAEPLSFGKYGHFQTFTYQKEGRQSLFVTDTQLPCRITRWRERDFTVASVSS